MIVGVGIDPGALGYLCVLDSSGEAAFAPAPKSPVELAGQVIAVTERACPIALEKALAMPKQARTNFAVGLTSGLWQGALAVALGLRDASDRLRLVLPSAWKRHAGLPSRGGGSTKADRALRDADAIEAARRLYPRAVLPVGPRSGKPRPDAACALLLAHYAATVPA